MTERNQWGNKNLFGVCRPPFSFDLVHHKEWRFEVKYKALYDPTFRTFIVQIGPLSVCVCSSK